MFTATSNSLKWFNLNYISIKTIDSSFDKKINDGTVS